GQAGVRQPLRDGRLNHSGTGWRQPYANDRGTGAADCRWHNSSVKLILNIVWVTLLLRWITHFAAFVWPKAARNPRASFRASSFAQKCMKNRCGESSSM